MANKAQGVDRNIQEKVMPSTARVPRDVRAETTVKPAPSLARVDITEGAPDAASDAALESTLGTDLEQVERVHAEHGDCSRRYRRTRGPAKQKSRLMAREWNDGTHVTKLA